MLNLGLSDTWRSEANIVCRRLTKSNKKQLVNTCIKHLPSIHEALSSVTGTGVKEANQTQKQK